MQETDEVFNAVSLEESLMVESAGRRSDAGEVAG